jgi:phosphate uptake regulator
MTTFVRRTQEMGGGTLLVSLPKQWTRSQNLSKGDSLAFETMPDGSLVVRPFTATESQGLMTSIPYVGQDIRILLNNVTSAYLLGYDLIKVSSSTKISYADASKLKNSLRQLIGLEVVEETPMSILCQFLLSTTNISPEKIFRRIAASTKSMAEEIFASLSGENGNIAELTLERDDEIDRLYFLLVRLLRSAVLNPTIASSFNLTPIDCLDYRVAANMLESAGDYAVQMANAVSKADFKTASVDVSRQLGEVLDTILDLAEKSISSFTSKNAAQARGAFDLFKGLGQKLDSFKVAPASARPKPAVVVGFYDLVKEFCRCHADVSDLVVSTDFRPRA